jgi:mono/diheme cytochrome c family protein
MSAHATPPGRGVFSLARLGLVVLALALGIAAGCGGSKTDTTDNTSTTTPPAPTTPPPDTSPSTPGAGANEPAAVLGPRVFAVRCALCHGADGHGDGVGARALNPKPRNFHDKAYMSTRTDAQLLEVIHNGKGAMPKWGGVLSEAEINAVLQHVRALGEKP